jgi:hypothetical protein
LEKYQGKSQKNKVRIEAPFSWRQIEKCKTQQYPTPKHCMPLYVMQAGQKTRLLSDFYYRMT